MGQMNLDEFLDFFEINPEQIHKEGVQEAETVAGYMIQVTGDLPKVGQSTVIGPLTCEVSQVVRHRIERVRVRKTFETSDESQA
jgi:CBS domain containing-hemolysin-like protein